MPISALTPNFLSWKLKAKPLTTTADSVNRRRPPTTESCGGWWYPTGTLGTVASTLERVILRSGTTDGFHHRSLRGLHRACLGVGQVDTPFRFTSAPSCNR